jgi:hypothetical protein
MERAGRERTEGAGRLLERARKALTMAEAIATRAAEARRSKISLDCASVIREAAVLFAVGLKR